MFYSQTQNYPQVVDDMLEERAHTHGKTSGIGEVGLCANVRWCPAVLACILHCDKCKYLMEERLA